MRVAEQSYWALDYYCASVARPEFIVLVLHLLPFEGAIVIRIVSQVVLRDLQVVGAAAGLFTRRVDAVPPNQSEIQNCTAECMDEGLNQRLY